jgi:hypothetical protein
MLDINTLFYDGDGVSGLYIWGAQLTDYSFNTTYIKTEASAFNNTINIPRDESNPTKDVLGYDLQYTGKVGGRASFVDSNCFRGNSSAQIKFLQNNFTSLAHFRIDFVIIPLSDVGADLLMSPVTKYNFSSTASFSIDVDSSSGPLKITVYDSVSGSVVVDIVDNSDLINKSNQPILCGVEIYGTTIKTYHNGILKNTGALTNGLKLVNYPFVISGTAAGNNPLSNFVQVAYFKLTELDASGNYVGDLIETYLSEFIQTPGSHTAYDISGSGNHATLVNGSTANRGLQDKYHWSMNGVSRTLGETIVNDNINLPERYSQDIVAHIDTLTTGQNIGGKNCIKVLATALEGCYFNNKITDYNKTWLLEGEVYIPTSSNITVVSLHRNLAESGAGSAGTYGPYNTNSNLITSKGEWVKVATLYNRFESYFNWHHHRAVDGVFDGTSIYYIRNLQLREYSEEYTTPILSDKSGFANGTALIDNGNFTQDGFSFLDTGTKLEHYKYPALVISEQNNRFFTDTNDDIVRKSFADFTGTETGDRIYDDISETDKVKNIRVHKTALNTRQANTEKIITNNI